MKGRKTYEEYPFNWPVDACQEVDLLEERLTLAEAKLKEFGQIWEEGKGYVFDGRA